MNKEEKQQLSMRLKNIISNMPEGPGSYQYYDESGEIIYVGKAKNLKRRVSSYFVKEQTRKTALLVTKIRDIKYINVATEQDALLLENSLIKRFQPRYNILLKDDKSYPYICLTKEDFPQIFCTRNKTREKAEYFGPYSHAATMYNVLDLIRNLYKIRSCRMPITEEGIKRGKYKLCLSYHINKCKGCCVGRQTREDYQQSITECRMLLKGHTREVKERLRARMIDLADEQRFEEAQELKVRYDLLSQFQAKSEVVSNTIGNLDVFNLVCDEKRGIINYLHIIDGAIIIAYTFEIEKKLEEADEDLLRFAIMETGQKFEIEYKEIVAPFALDIPFDNVRITVPKKGDKKSLLDLSMRNVQQYKVDKLKRSEYLNPEQKQVRLMKELQEKLHLTKLPVTIELFDNSNLQGQDAVAGCVVYKKLKPSRQNYRKYTIKTVEGSNDYASMQEVVRRRYSRFIEENTPLPDLIIVDGGQGQMEYVRRVVEDELNLRIPIAGLAKDYRHQTNELMFGFPPIVIGFKPNSELFKVLSAMQEEVHRYAISFHKARRAKRQMKSELDQIKGIGKVTKELLIKTFKTLKRIKNANLLELQNLLGNKKGERIWHALHDR